ALATVILTGEVEHHRVGVVRCEEREDPLTVDIEREMPLERLERPCAKQSARIRGRRPDVDVARIERSEPVEETMEPVGSQLLEARMQTRHRFVRDALELRANRPTLVEGNQVSRGHLAPHQFTEL